MTQSEKEQLRGVKGRVHHTESFGAVDGPGIRYVFFLQGCPMRCLYCHNPDATSRSGGTVWTAGEAVEEVLRYRAFIRSGGVTLSGGEPLLQPLFVAAVARLLREEGIGTAIDTAGCEDPADGAVRAAIDAAELILLDIKAWDQTLAVALTGRDTGMARATLAYCEETQKDVWVRHVLLQGYTLDDGQLEALADYLAGFRAVRRVELLPFHKLGEPKWDPGTYTLHNTPATSEAQVRHAKEIFAARGLQVQ